MTYLYNLPNFTKLNSVNWNNNSQPYCFFSTYRLEIVSLSLPSWLLPIVPTFKKKNRKIQDPMMGPLDWNIYPTFLPWKTRNVRKDLNFHVNIYISENWHENWEKNQHPLEDVSFFFQKASWTEKWIVSIPVSSARRPPAVTSVGWFHVVTRVNGPFSTSAWDGNDEWRSCGGRTIVSHPLLPPIFPWKNKGCWPPNNQGISYKNPLKM